MSLAVIFPSQVQDLDILVKIGVLCSIFGIGGVFGFLYETIFYYFNDGKLVKRGSGFGPWIQIYGFGSLLIFFVAAGDYKNPLVVLLKSAVLCGGLELIIGYLLFHIFDGFRSWDYNTEKWNWGNIGGYVCFRSVAFFAVSGLLLVYAILPVLLMIVEHVGIKTVLIPSAILSALFLLDILYNDILVQFLPLDDALTIYERHGIPNNLPESSKKKSR